MLYKTELLKGTRPSFPGAAACNEIGLALDKHSTDDLYNYVRDKLNMGTALRAFLEDQIAAQIINEERYSQTF